MMITCLFNIDILWVCADRELIWNRSILAELRIERVHLIQFYIRDRDI